jgi:transcriptional regulator with XRE-family HTH domain
MEALGERIQELRKSLGLSQIDLANKIEVSKAQMSRYENQGIQPPADVLNKMADALGTSVDYLINGSSQEKAKTSLKNNMLLQKFKEMEQLPENDLDAILKVINAYLRDYKAKQAYGT